MDFMQCINFKSRLDREREMIRRKIRTSTLYRKPSFSKSAGFNIYNANGEVTKVSVITKNLKINEFKDEPLRKIKSPLLVNDEQEDECLNEEKSILCIGSKYLDITSNLLAAPSMNKSLSTTSINMSNETAIEKTTEPDFEKAISQSHLSPSSPLPMNFTSVKKLFINETQMMQENLKKSKTANNINTNNNNKIPNVILFKSDNDKTLDGDDDSPATNQAQTHDTIHSPSSDKRNANTHNNNNCNKIYKKSAHTKNFYCGAVGYNVGKYSDAQKTEVVLDDLPNSITEQSNNCNNNNNTIVSNNKTPHNTTVSSNASTIKTGKKSAAMTRKKSRKSDTTKCESLKSATTRKSENS